MKHLLFILGLCTFNMLTAQDCTHTFLGEVKDFHDGTPISGATVYIKSLDKYTTSDINGKFSIKDICPGVMELVISHVGCETLIISIDVDGDVFKEILLEHHIEELHEVKVSGKAQKNITRTGQETQLSGATLEEYSSQNLGDVLKEISGVSSINTGNAIVKPVINGLHSSRISVITNGVLLQDQEWGIEHAPNIDLNAAGSINLLKGSNALSYSGDAIGGVVVLQPPKISLKDSLYGKTIISGQTNGRGFNTSSSLTKSWREGWFATGQASFKRFGDFETPTYILTNTGLKAIGLNLSGGYSSFEKGFNLNYSFINNEIGILRAAHIGNISDLVNAINSGQPTIIEGFSYDINAPRQDVTHQIFKAEYYQRFKKFGRLDLHYDFQDNQRFEYDVRRTDDNKAAIDLNLKTHTVKADLKLDANNRAIFNFGLLTRYQNNFANPNTGIRRLIPDYDKYDLGVYGITNIKWRENINLDFGVRYDFNRIDAKKFYLKSRWEERGYDVDFADIVIREVNNQLLTNPVYNFHNVALSAGMAYNLSNKQTLLFNYGFAQRAPNPSELFSEGLHHSAARIELGDLRLDQETSNRIGATYQLKTYNLNITAEGFLNHISDYMQIVPFGTEQTIRGAFPVWEYMQTNALLLGIDTSVLYAVNDSWSFSNKSSIIKGRDTKMKMPLIDMPSFKTLSILNYSNEKWSNFNASIESEWVLRQNEFPNFNFETYIPTTEETVLVDISSPPPAYHLLHFKSDVTFNISKSIKSNIALSVFNLLNTSYRDYLNRLRYFADDLGRNFMLQLKINY